MSEVLPPSDGTVTWVTCPKCSAQMLCYDPTNSRFFGCFNCRTYFHVNPKAPNYPARRLKSFRGASIPGPSFPLGTVGTLSGYRCCITGYQLRSEKGDRTALWHEYQLRPAEPLPNDEPANFPLQLAEYEGHWLLIRRAPRHPDTRGPRTIQNNEWYDTSSDQTYRLWHRYMPVICDARGEFDWDIFQDEALFIAEYTSPPYLLVSEQLNDIQPTWYLAEHLEPAEVAMAFGVAIDELPSRNGIGAAQPPPVPNWPQLRNLALLAGLLLTALQLLLVFTHQPVHFDEQHFTITEPAAGGNSQMLVSRSFNLPNSTAIAVELETPFLVNHWIELTASLVNEQTGRGYEFTRSLEFYSGIEDGESWSEGKRMESVVLSAVPAGHYHFNLYPTVDKGIGEAPLNLRIEANTPLWSNYWIMLFVLALIPLGIGLRRYLFEQSRWQNSDFGPSGNN
jgi:hypothetical protein